MDPNFIITAISGAILAGGQIVQLISSVFRAVRGLEEELNNVTTSMETLTTSFDIIKSEIQKRESDSHLPPRAKGNILAIVKDTKELHDKIRLIVEGGRSKHAKPKYVFRRKDVEAWDRQISRNVQTLGTLMSTLSWSASWSNTPNAATAAPVTTTSIAEQSQAQMYQSALCDEGLALLDESFVDLGANSLDLDENPGLEPQYYI